MENIAGLPAHPLLVHAVVGIVPLVAVLAIGVAVSEWVRSRLGWLTVLGALGMTLLIPLVTDSGESLQERVPETALVRQHADMGEQLLPFVAVLFVALAVFMWLHRRRDRNPRSSYGARSPGWVRPVLVLAALVTVVTAVASTVQVVRIGHSGAKAVWSGTPTEER